ncbi:hypothetical protein PTSG_11233 [Salpingoeca rosetta]|uniref:EGF-like domain-containing protein n=1 Tax=Salpingoeca rosetta (strain ATCC 50818 / BSB-021) TaxID=946362 RepID=F2UST8_SALR5|nr:uncharacterized protein PTSG_11233 [Salpingoeca rosetta]EGD81197.1 hypothetical protein PTSG_11233 [Salpingoeca rosetta]|eukprot:XP_004987732.1 hypothetical protein PTSG_11233 [Salpingoeca rosetta]
MKLALLLAALVAATLLSETLALGTCSSNGITSQSSCNSQCSGRSNCFCSFVDFNGATCSCASTSGFTFSCTDIGGSVVDDDDTPLFGGDDDDDSIFNYPSCSSDGVTSQSTCDNRCSGSSCFCYFTVVAGVTACSCADSSGSVYVCSDTSGATGSSSGDDDFFSGFSADDDLFPFGGDDDLSIQYSSCNADGVRSQSSCDSRCSGSNCFCYFVTYSGYNTCSCADLSGSVYVCTDIPGVPTSATSNDDDDAPSSSLVTDVLVTYLGERCRSSINNAVSSSLINCIANADTELAVFNDDDFADDDGDDGFPTPTELDGICRNRCVGQIFRSIQLLQADSCLPTISNIPSVDDDDNGILSGFAEFASFASYKDLLGLACTQGNGVYCSEVADAVSTLFDDPANFGAAQCQMIVGAGNCLGTLRAAFEANPDLFDLSGALTADLVIQQLSATCDTFGVSGVTEAASATEAPSSIASSSATTVSGVVAAVVTLAAAAIMA